MSVQLIGMNSNTNDDNCNSQHVSSSSSAGASTDELLSSDSTVALRLEKPSKTRFLAQILAATALYLGPISLGCVIGYSSPALNDLEKPGRSIHLDDQETSLFGSLSTLGALIGGLISGILVDYFGRKFSLILINVPYVIGWMLIVYSNWIQGAHISMIYAGRIITGMCMGIISMACPIYLSEISSPEIRGILGSGFQLFVCVGIALTYVIGSIVSWTMLALLSSTMAIALMIAIIPLPESPVWLLRQKRKEDAMDSLIWLRGKHANIQDEYDAINHNILKETSMSFSDIHRPDIMKPFVIIVFEMFFQQFSGINAVIFNATTIFKSATTAIDPSFSSIIMMTTSIFAVAASLFFIDRTGRRALLMVSCAGCSLSLAILGAYYYVKHTNESSAASISWLPLACLILYTVAFSLGLGPIPWVMMGELFPPQARGIASSITTALNWGSAFVVTKTFINLQNTIWDHGVFWMYAGICALGVLFVWKFVPETKGKTLEEIQKDFDR